MHGTFQPPQLYEPNSMLMYISNYLFITELIGYSFGVFQRNRTIDLLRKRFIFIQWNTMQQ